MSSSVFLPPAYTRLVTIIAQVDHGKTTLADSLIESNGIISERLAGTLRYLDSLEEEQRRGITMRTSAIGLRHKHKKNDFVVHLLDSPGHVDFAPEVSSALRCCDGALLVVDAVEGLCARTHQVLRESHTHQLVPVMVINKVDRLCCDLGLTPTEAYLRLRGLVESINAASAAMFASPSWTFDPTKGNVVFASALYGWGFTVPSLARALYRSGTIPIKPIIMRQYLFGDFKYKDSKVLKWKGKDQADPFFAEYGLGPIWNIYEEVSAAAISAGLGSDLFSDGRNPPHATTTTPNNNEHAKIKADTPGLDRVSDALQWGATGTNVPDVTSILSQTGAFTEESVLRAVLRRYRPLGGAVLDAVCEQCPGPDAAASTVRTQTLALALPDTTTTTTTNRAFQAIQKAVTECSPTNNTMVAHICKFLATGQSHLQDVCIDTSNDTNIILGLARILSGTFTTDETYYCMGPKHVFGGEAPRRKVRLYLLMGSSFVPVKAVPAGHLCAVYGLEDLQLKTVTLCDDKHGMPLKVFDRGVHPLVKVNVEPDLPDDTDALERGLIKLSLADAAVEVTATAKGERILACLGELHLEQSIHDLETVYCGKEMKLRISEPIVEFGETTAWFDNEQDYAASLDDSLLPLRQTTIPPYNEEEGIAYARRGRMRVVVSGRGAAIGIRAVPLANGAYRSLLEKALVEGCEQDVLYLGRSLGCQSADANSVLQELLEGLSSTDSNGNALMETKGLANGVYARGVVGDSVYIPNSTGDNESCGEEDYELLRTQIREGGFSGAHLQQQDALANAVASRVWSLQMRGSMVAGFQLGVRAGPVCEEPVHGVLILLESAEVALQHKGDDYSLSKPLSGGMVVAALRQGIRCALLSRPVRLVEGHLRLTLHSTLNGLGSLYAVLSKRRGRVMEDSMVDGTNLLLIAATLPQAESFGLAPELMRKTSGEVTVPELTFLKWERLEEDPFWIPTSLEERADFGEIVVNGDLSTGIDNTAIQYIRQVRERKGLLVDSNKTVVAAEKQRTMKR